MHRIALRHARMFLAVAEHQNVTQAAKVINRSQTAVTKSIQDLERQLGVALFDRSTRGVTLNVYGKALIRGVSEARRVFREAEQHIAPAMLRNARGAGRVFDMDVSEKWLEALVSVSDAGSIPAAAEQLGITAAAVSASIRKLEDMLNMTLFERSPNAVVATGFAQVLVRCTKLARNELRHACDELASLQGTRRGSVTVGTLPFSRTMLVPRAIATIRKKYPAIDIATLEGPYEDLATALRCGDIDLIVGALRGAATQTDLCEEALLDDQLSVIVSQSHPLLSQRRVEWQDLMQYQWILPRRVTPTRLLFERALRSRKLPAPEHVVETSSLVMLRGLLLEDDYITVLSRHQVYYEEQAGLLLPLPIELPETRRPIGLTRRRLATLSPATGLFLDSIREACRTLPDHGDY